MRPQVAHWPDVKATAIATGSLKEAAEAHGIEHDAVKQRAKREAWPVGRRVHKLLKEAQEAAGQQIIRANNGNVTRVTSTADALLNTLAERKKQTTLGLSKWSANSATHLGELTGEQASAAHQAAVGTASVMTKLWREQQQPMVRLSLHSQQMAVQINNGSDEEQG